ncbi:MAG: PTS sugar transporter subunit IIC, partial [Elusimicrobiota bacterium]
MTWHFAALPMLSVLAAALEADSVHVGQWMLSRPVIVGPLFGAVLGSAWTGALLGSLLEMVGLDSKPVGGVVPANGTVAAAIAVVLCLGPDGVVPAAAFPAALACGALFSRIEGGL